MRRESHVQFCEGVGVKLPRATQLVVLHKDRAVVEEGQRYITGWLKPMGLELKPSKTQIVHTLRAEEREPGFKFLGFEIRQYPAGKNRSSKDTKGRCVGFKALIKPSKEGMQKHIEKLRETLHKNRSTEQENLIKILAPSIVGWCAYYATVVSKDAFSKVYSVLFAMLFAWATRRHPDKGKKWIADKYFRHNDGLGWVFQPRGSRVSLPKHQATPIRRHIKVAGRRSPYDGDWVYWSARMGREPTTPARVSRLLKEQGGRCRECGLYFRSGDQMEVDHAVPRAQGGTGTRKNLQLLHRHCHDRKTACDQRGTHDKRHAFEEPYDGKPSRTVLKPSRGGDVSA